MRDLEPRREHDGEPAVGVAAGRGCHAVDHFLLQHHVQVHHVVDGLEQVEEQRRRNVVGQIAHDSQWSAALSREVREIERERIADVQAQRVAEPRGERRGEIAIDLHRIDAAGRGDEAIRDRAGAGADLDDAIARTHADRVDDPLSHTGIVQEVLPEPLADDRLHEAWRSREARCVARRSAASRLPASARPVPARSSAVP